MDKYLLVMLGGGLGAAVRYAVGTYIIRFYSAVFPAGTFVINITGSFAIGVLMMLFLNRPAIHTNWRLFLVTGILGGYTTFSSFEWETYAALRTGASLIALLNAVGSVLLGFAGAWLGAIIASRLWPR